MLGIIIIIIFLLVLSFITCSLRASMDNKLTKQVICRMKSNNTARAAYNVNTRTAGMGVIAPGNEMYDTCTRARRQTEYEGQETD